jgi:hypothetical protein
LWELGIGTSALMPAGPVLMCCLRIADGLNTITRRGEIALPSRFWDCDRYVAPSHAPRRCGGAGRGRLALTTSMGKDEQVGCDAARNARE